MAQVNYKSRRADELFEGLEIEFSARPGIYRRALITEIEFTKVNTLMRLKMVSEPAITTRVSFIHETLFNTWSNDI